MIQASIFIVLAVLGVFAGLFVWSYGRDGRESMAVLCGVVCLLLLWAASDVMAPAFVAISNYTR